ncbi:hypothetical protein AVEN_73094-1 [Araneus ventricosus]|uniref:Endonuclease/exonuclease/phosphatase domain-containing protein n=1 Tax=Araneus ventricosus TaxID=182803 RepID=A0A4Y2IZ33_ARAVE|nr:hypothetical protein AVEN_73094-1 [Araneus ventricosus]
MDPFVSWNCRGIRSKLVDIKALINTSHPVCVALEEAFLKPSHCLKLRGYSCVRKDDDTGVSASGGVFILTSNLYPSTTLTLHTCLQAVAVPVHVRTLVTVCCIYLPPNDTISQNDLNTLIDKLPTPFIFFGDFNGHSTMWGSDSTNSRGRQIEQFISNNSLCLLNNDETTYFHEPTRTFHSLDLAICSPQLLPLLNFTVGNYLYNSDHFPLIVSHADKGGTTRPPPRYVFQRADWDAFTQLAEITDTMVSTSDITEAVQNVIDCIINREQKRRWNIFRRCPTTENLITFKRATASARRVRRRSQRESWIRFIFSITSSTPSKLLWKKVKAANGIYEGFSFPVLNTGNVVVSSSLEVANTLRNALAQVSAADSYSSAFVAINNRAERQSLHFFTRRSFPYNSEFRMYELQTALPKAHDTSPGPDGIAYKMLRHLSLSSLSNLLYLFNRSWNEQKSLHNGTKLLGFRFSNPEKIPLTLCTIDLLRSQVVSVRI